MPLSCPKCNGHEVQALPIVFNTGQAGLLEAAAPPKKGSYLHIFEFWFLGTMIMDLVSKMFQFRALGSLFIVTIFATSLYCFIRAFNFNRKEWPALYEKWQHSYICIQCSNIFDVTAPSNHSGHKAL